MDQATSTTSYCYGPPDDDLALVMRRRLERPLPRAGAWGLLATIVLGVASFGLLPLLVWPTRFREYVAEEARALQDLAEWARVRGRRPAAVGPVLAAAEDVAFRPVPWLACILLAVFVVASFAMQFSSNVTLTWDWLLRCTYYYRIAAMEGRPPFWVEHLHHVWAAALTVAYGLHWIQVRTHRADVKRFVARLNPVIAAELLPPIPAPSRRLGLGPLWVLTAVVLGMYGAWWGIPMVLAGAAQRRYLRVTGPALRRELVSRMRDISENRRLPATIATGTASRCANPRCQSALAPLARFCRRCGSPAGMKGTATA
jgi:hypothetical protein